MATYQRATGHAANDTIHDDVVFRDAVYRSIVGEMMGKKGSGAPIIVDFEMQGVATDTKKVHVVPFVDANPISGQDSVLEGNESAITEAIFSVTIDEENWPFAKNGRMTDQRSRLNWSNEAKMQIGNLAMQYNNDEAFRQLSGMTKHNLTDAQDNTTNRVNGANRCFQCVASSGVAVVVEDDSDATSLDANMSTNDVFNLDAIEQTVAHVETKRDNDYRLNPMGPGRDDSEMFHLWIDPLQAISLRKDARWQNEALSLIESGVDSKFKDGYIGMWNNVIVRKTNRIQRFNVTGTDTYARALLLGRDALFMAWAQTLAFADNESDYGRKKGMAGYEIRGAAKVSMSIDPATDPEGTGAAGTATASQDLGVAQIVSAVEAL